MYFPLYIFIIIYIVYLLIFCFFVFAMIYHLVRFGFKSFNAFLATFLFLGGSILILALSFKAFTSIDWRMKVEFFPGFDFETNYFQLES